MRLGKVRTQLKSRTVFADRLIEIALAHEQLSEVVSGFSELRLNPKRSLKFCPSPLRVSRPLKDQAYVVSGLGVVRIQLNGLAEMLQSGIVVSLLKQDQS